MVWKSPADINWSKGAGEGVNYLNEVTRSIFSNMLLLSLYVILLWGFYKARDDFIGGLAVAGVGTFLVAFFMWLGQWVGNITFGICFAVMVVGVSALLIDSRNR